MWQLNYFFVPKGLTPQIKKKKSLVYLNTLAKVPRLVLYLKTCFRLKKYKTYLWSLDIYHQIEREGKNHLSEYINKDDRNTEALTYPFFVQHRARRIHIEECLRGLDRFNRFVPIMTGSFNYNTSEEQKRISYETCAARKHRDPGLPNQDTSLT